MCGQDEAAGRGGVVPERAAGVSSQGRRVASGCVTTRNSRFWRPRNLWKGRGPRWSASQLRCRWTDNVRCGRQPDPAAPTITVVSTPMDIHLKATRAFGPCQTDGRDSPGSGIKRKPCAGERRQNNKGAACLRSSLLSIAGVGGALDGFVGKCRSRWGWCPRGRLRASGQEPPIPARAPRPQNRNRVVESQERTNER